MTYDFTPDEPEGPGCGPIVVAILIFMLGAVGAMVSWATGGNVFTWVGSVALMALGIALFVRLTR